MNLEISVKHIITNQHRTGGSGGFLQPCRVCVCARLSSHSGLGTTHPGTGGPAVLRYVTRPVEVRNDLSDGSCGIVILADTQLAPSARLVG
jgi:hypothetical protein